MIQGNKTDHSFSAIILAAGLSERMGKPKALLMWDQSKTFLEKIAGEFADAGCDKIVCTVNEIVLPHCKPLEAWKNLKLVLNEHPEWGRMHSVKLGLQEVKESHYCFIQNADNPFIDSGTIRKILEAKDPGKWCSPEFNGKAGHPVLLPNLIINLLLENNPDKTLQELLHSFPKKVVEMNDDSVLKNINTPEDYLSLLNRNS
jgi:molybdenum cofactor cytidylyltransferase